MKWLNLKVHSHCHIMAVYKAFCTPTCLIQNRQHMAYSSQEALVLQENIFILHCCIEALYGSTWRLLYYVWGLFNFFVNQFIVRTLQQERQLFHPSWDQSAWQSAASAFPMTSYPEHSKCFACRTQSTLLSGRKNGNPRKNWYKLKAFFDGSCCWILLLHFVSTFSFFYFVCACVVK